MLVLLLGEMPFWSQFSREKRIYFSRAFWALLRYNFCNNLNCTTHHGIVVCQFSSVCLSLKILMINKEFSVQLFGILKDLFIVFVFLDPTIIYRVQRLDSRMQFGHLDDLANFSTVSILFILPIFFLCWLHYNRLFYFGEIVTKKTEMEFQFNKQLPSCF